MYRRKVMVTATAVFAIGVAFAAQPTALRAEWGKDAPRLEPLWVPGTNSLMPAGELSLSALTPPR